MWFWFLVKLSSKLDWHRYRERWDNLANKIGLIEEGVGRLGVPVIFGFQILRYSMLDPAGPLCKCRDNLLGGSMR